MLRGAGACFFLAGALLTMLLLWESCVIHCFHHPLNSSGFAGSCLRPHNWATGWNLGCSRYSEKEALQGGIFSHVPSPCSVVKEVWKKSCFLPVSSPDQGVATDFIACSQELNWWSSQPDVLLLRLSVACCCGCVLLDWEGVWKHWGGLSLPAWLHPTHALLLNKL